MGAADDIKKGLTKNLANFTKQRKAEEKHSSAGRWRMSRMIEVRGKFLTEAADEVMEECYMKASDNNRLPATARQIFYVARPLIEEQTDKPLSYSYFSQTLLPNYVNEHEWCGLGRGLRRPRTFHGAAHQAGDRPRHPERPRLSQPRHAAEVGGGGF